MAVRLMLRLHLKKVRVIALTFCNAVLGLAINSRD